MSKLKNHHKTPKFGYFWNWSFCNMWVVQSNNPASPSQVRLKLSFGSDNILVLRRLLDVWNIALLCLVCSGAQDTILQGNCRAAPSTGWTLGCQNSGVKSGILALWVQIFCRGCAMCKLRPTKDSYSLNKKDILLTLLWLLTTIHCAKLGEPKKKLQNIPTSQLVWTSWS